MFNRTEDSAEKYNEAKARETLETVLLVDGQYEKRNNLKYNQDKFLDDLIREEIPGSDVKGDVAIIGEEYAYELDRSVPKIGTGGKNGYLGNPKDLVWPTVTVEPPVLAGDWRTSSFIVNAIEETNGINKIEIWFAGEKIETLDKTYNNVKTQLKEKFTVNKNGVYTVKVYGELMISATVEVKGIVPAVEFSPNGSTEWKQQHTTKITVKETGEKIKSIKYKWTTSGANGPNQNEFTEMCPSDNIITGKDMTGTYYLWILVEMDTEPKKVNICGSQGFNFDNEGPTVTIVTGEETSNSILINVSAVDSKSGISNPIEYNYFIKKTSETEYGEAKYIGFDNIYTFTELETNNSYDIKVTTKDNENNIGENILQISYCIGSTIQSVKCSNCSGRGTTSYSTGCGACGGDGYSQDEVKCSFCSGTGKRNGKSCSMCKGTGTIAKVKCDTCGGSGRRSYTTTCGACKGSGKRNEVKPCVHSKTIPHFSKK